MPEKPTTASGYPPGQVARVKSTCLYLATKLGDLMDELVVVGGLVPSLLIDQEKLPENVTPHVGTLDLDLGLPMVKVKNPERAVISILWGKTGVKTNWRPIRSTSDRSPLKSMSSLVKGCNCLS